MPKRQRNYAAEYARRQQRAKQQGTSYAKLRRLDAGTRSRIYEAQAAVDDAYARSLPEKYLPEGRRRKRPGGAQTSRTAFQGGEHFNTAPGQFRAILNELRGQHAGPVSLAITVEGRRVFVNSMRADISNMAGEEKNAGKGSTPERGGRRVTGLEMWTRDPSGFDIDDLLGLIDFYGNPTDALFNLWQLTDSPSMRRRPYRNRRR